MNPDPSTSIPVVDVDQSFPFLTADTTRQKGSGASSSDVGPLVESVLRDVLGWRPRAADAPAFTAALAASFDLKGVEGHVLSTYRPRGFSMQADLGGVSGGQASLFARAMASRSQILTLLDGLVPLRTDADDQDCDAFRALVRDAVTRLVDELGAAGGPRVPVVDSAFGMLTGWQPLSGSLLERVPADVLVGTTVTTDPDTVPGQLGALRDRFGLTDAQVNTVAEEQVRTAYWTLVDLVLDLQRAWESRRGDFVIGGTSGFLGTELILVSRLLHAAAEQVTELEDVLDSVFVPLAERQTLVLDADANLTLAGLLDWLRAFLTEDGPRIARDTGRDGMLTSFTPTVLALLETVWATLAVHVLWPDDQRGSSVREVVHIEDDEGETDILEFDDEGTSSLELLGRLPAGLYAARVRIATTSLVRQLESLAATAARIGRFPDVVLFDVTVSPFHGNVGTRAGGPLVRVEVRGLNLQPSFVPALVSRDAAGISYVLPVPGSTTADGDTLVGLFEQESLPARIPRSRNVAVFPARAVPVDVVDAVTGRPAAGTQTRLWPTYRPVRRAARPRPTGGTGGASQTPDQAPPRQK